MSEGRRDARSVAEVVAQLDREALVRLVVSAADWHEDVERSVRIVAARAAGDVRELKAQVDGALLTRRFLGYRESAEWARAARPVVEQLEAAAREAPSAALVELLQRAIAHVVKTIMRADDSSGLMGDLARDLLEAHAVACDAGVADPKKLAAWMFRFRFEDQDFFEADPVRYREALGERGVAAFRRAVAGYDGRETFAVRYARERLAVLDGDVDRIVELLGGDLSSAHQFRAVAEAMIELDRDDLALHWAQRGIAETGGWQVAYLYDLACRVHERRQEPLEVLRVRRAEHERLPSSSTYAAVRRAAEAIGSWEIERDAARARLAAHDRRGFVDALLADGDAELAWEAAGSMSPDEVGDDLWLRLADARSVTKPAEAFGVYERLVDAVLVTTGQRSYASAIRILKRARSAADAAGTPETFIATVTRLREAHRRRPTFIAMLDKAQMP